MPSLTEICVRRPVFAIMLTTALIVAGVASYPQLGIARFPRLDLPTVTVEVTYPGASQDEVETEVTRIIEDAVATIAGIQELRSVSQDSQSVVLITFSLNRRLDAAVQDVRDAIAVVGRRLPPTADVPIVRQQDLDAAPVLTIALSGPFSSRELYVFARRGIKEVIESAEGVGSVGIGGAAPRAVRIDLDAQRLAAYRISVLEVRDALAQQNVEIPGGRVDAGSREYTLRTIGRLPQAQGFADLAVTTGSGGTVRLGDLAEVSDGTKELRQLARFNGQPAVVVYVQRQTDANTVATIRAVKERLARSREMLPPEVKLEILQDQSNYIEAALHEIQAHLVSGSILATIVVLLFMRSWRSTLIAAIVIPASIISSFAFMRAFGFTLNNVTMLALMLMVGVVIDDAIVVLENIHRCIEEKGMPPMQAAIEGTREIGLAVLATTLSLVIVFLPVSFLSSVAGRMLFEFGVTATVAILVSMFVSFTLTPMMCSRLLLPAAASSAADAAGKQGSAAASRRGPYRWLEAGYLAALRWSLDHRWVIVAVSVVVVASNVWLARVVPRDYIPTNVDESEFGVSITGESGLSLAAIDAIVQQAAERVQAMPGVTHVLATVGSPVGSLSVGRLYVRLTDINTRTFTWRRLLAGLLAGDPAAAWRDNFSQRETMAAVRQALADLPDIRVAVRNLTALQQGAAVDIDLALTGPTLEALLPLAAQLRERARMIPGVVDVDTTLRIDKPQMLARLDRERMADVGVTVQEVADTLRIAVGGDDRVSRYRDPADGDVYDVELRLVGIDRGDSAAISQLFVRGGTRPAVDGNEPAYGESLRAASGAVRMRLDNVVDFEIVDEAGRIDRLDRQRMVALRANVAPGFALGDRLAAIREAVAEVGLPPGVTARVMGQGRELERTLGEFGWTFLLSLVFMYIVLAAQYEHLVHPITILLSLPLAVPFGLASLWAGGETLNLYSALGILVLFGVVKKAAILQVDHTRDLQAAGLPQRQAILDANRDRLRPILMTTISFVAGMLPLLIATGPGAEERRSIAVVASGGQVFSLLLTLLAVPVIYSLLDDFGRLVRR
ncbi:MAG: efflux RND transporter permease subunit [Pirellulales bacterium]